MELNNHTIGSYIKAMRMRAGLTQHELAARIGVGGRTVSKWEQGRGIPDISLLYSLSLELDVDIESLLAGNPDDIGKEWLGIICTGTAETSCIEEQEWKWMISMFLLAGIRDIAACCGGGGAEKAGRFLSAYCDRGFLRGACCTDSVEEILHHAKEEKKQVCFLYQSAFLYGMHLTRYMRRAMLGRGVRALVLRQGRDSFMPGIRFGRSFPCCFAGDAPESEWRLFPMLFGNGREIAACVERAGDGMDIRPEAFPALHAEPMERGMLAFSFRTKNDRALTRRVLVGIEESQGIRIGDPEEIMRVRGWG